MAKKKVNKFNTKPTNIGVVNPYALVELKLKKKVNWKQVKNPRKLLEKTLNMPYKKLFDPKFNSPLYPGLKVNPKTKRVEKIKALSDENDQINVLIHAVILDPWRDAGVFFKEASEMMDPVQGALADCYHIAAQSSVAWARTYAIAQRTRATGTNQQSFVDLIRFYDDGQVNNIEVSERIPMTTGSNPSFIYARSSEQGEIWPAIYEKAYAKWKGSTSGDRPDYSVLNYGDPVLACAQLTGLRKYYYSNPSLSTDVIWTRIRENCMSQKTFNPMVARTYGSSNEDVDYNNTNIVANHAYSLIGWHTASGKRYVVLRNPWGQTEPSISADGGTWYVWDAPYHFGPGWTRAVALTPNDGIIALGLAAFKSYFAGFGLVK